MKMSHKKSVIPTKMKGHRKDRVWRHNQPKNMHCGRCGGHVDGVLKREGPKWVFYCRGGHHVFKTLIRDKKSLVEEGLLHSGGLDDPRYTARKARIREDARQAREKQLHNKDYTIAGRHRFI